MSITDFYLPHWIGLLDALGVMLAFVAWLVVADERWDDVRPAVALGGGLLLVIAVGGVLSRLGGEVTRFALPGGYGGGQERTVADLLVLLVGLAGGIWAATRATGPDEDVADDADDDDDADEEVAADAPAIPARAWSGTEVLGHDESEEEDADPWRPVAPEWVRARRADARGVGVPLLAVAVALGLPALSFFQVADLPDGFRLPTVHVHAVHAFSHLVDGLLLGGALLGAAIALDLWERRTALLAFTLLAFGTGLLNGFPRTFNNRWWSVLGIGLAVGLVAPGALRALRRAEPPGRLATVLGVLGGLVLIVASSYLRTRASIVTSFTSYP